MAKVYTSMMDAMGVDPSVINKCEQQFAEQRRQTQPQRQQMVNQAKSAVTGYLGGAVGGQTVQQPAPDVQMGM